jgi:hypothetical protein
LLGCLAICKLPILCPDAQLKQKRPVPDLRNIRPFHGVGQY